MGRVKEQVKVRNLLDLHEVSQGEREAEEVRTVEVDALVDTGATYLCLPPALIEELGLPYSHSQKVRTANGAVQRRIFDGAKIMLRDREVQMAVMENDEDTPALMGYLVLEAIDFVVDSKGQKLVPNPEHDGKWVVDLY